MKKSELGFVIVAVSAIVLLFYFLLGAPSAFEYLAGLPFISSILSVSTVTLVVTTLFNIRTVRADTRAKKMQAFDILLREWNRSKEAQKYVLTTFRYPSEDLDREQVSRMLSVCTRIAFMVNRGLISEEDTAEFIGARMVMLWEKLSTYVYGEERPVYGNSRIYFEDFVENTLKRKYWKYENERLVFKGRLKSGFSKERLKEMKVT